MAELMLRGLDGSALLNGKESLFADDGAFDGVTGYGSTDNGTGRGDPCCNLGLD